MRGKAVEAESPSGNGIVLTSAETGQVGERGRERGRGGMLVKIGRNYSQSCVIVCGVGTPWYWEVLL